MMIKLRPPKRFSRSTSKVAAAAAAATGCGSGRGATTGEIKWELRPGGMLVQKRECKDSEGEGMITIRVSTFLQCHHMTIKPTSTFGELKMLLSYLTNLEPKEQRLLFKGKEREDDEHLHMVGVRDKDKVLMLEDPAIKERKKLLTRIRIGSPISV